MVSFIHITERTGDTMPKAWQVTVACLLQLTGYYSCLSIHLLCQSSLTDSTKIIRGLSAVQDTKIRELIHLCLQEFIILLLPSLVLPLCYLDPRVYLYHLYLFSFYGWTLLSALKWKVRLGAWWGYSKSCYCHGSTNAFMLLILSFTHSFICSLKKCLLNVSYVLRTVQNSGDRWWAKTHAFMESIIYCERNTCMKVTPAMGTYTWGNYYEGRDLEGLEGGVEENKPNGPGELSRQRKHNTAGLPLWSEGHVWSAECEEK